MTKLIAYAICLLLSASAAGEVITVDDDGPADFADIQEAIINAANGDIVEVQPGVYFGNLNFYGRAITVTSTNPSDPNIVTATIIDRREEFHSIRFDCGEDSNSVLTGFTVRATNLAKGKGVGIYCYYSSPLISRNVIFDHWTAIQGESGYPTLINNYIHNNNGFGIAGCNGEIRNCTIENNDQGAMCDCDGSIADCVIGPSSVVGLVNCDGAITNCVITSNSVGLQDCNGQIGNCTVVYNQGDGLQGCHVEIKNCIVAFNGGYGLSDCRGTPNYNNVWDNACGNYAGGTLPGIGDIHVDPLFVAADDYHLESIAGHWNTKLQQWIIDDVTSPCIDAGDPNSDWAGELWPHGQRINMGAYGGTAQASMSLSDAGNVADLDSDDAVDYNDLMLFSEQWANGQVLLSQDLNRNGAVDFIDFVIFADNWLWEE